MSGRSVAEYNMKKLNLLIMPDETADVNVAVNGTDVGYSHSFPIERNSSYALAAKLSQSTADVKFELEVGLDLPSTEKAADSSWSVEDSGNEIFTLTSDSQASEAFTPPAMPFARIKATGQGTNHASQEIEKLVVLISPNAGTGV